jgi:hypothetical protein
MPGFGCDLIWQIAEGEGFRFHFQVDLRVEVRGVQGDMPKPSPDGIDVHAGSKPAHVGHRKGKTYVQSISRRCCDTGQLGNHRNINFTNT